MAFISSGTTILDNGAFSVGLGSQILLSTATASSSASIEFTSGIDSTYDIYKWEYISIHPQNDIADFQLNFSSDGGSNYNVTKTTTNFRAFHFESDESNLEYYAAGDLAQSTSFLEIADRQDNDNDSCCVANIFLFAPSSTTYVKHFIFTGNRIFGESTNAIFNDYIAGYCNTTSAINAIKFQFSSGNIDAGTIKMYGIKGS